MTARPQDVALLPCPFCGERAKLHDAEDEDSTHWWAQCSVCGAVSGEKLADSTPDKEFATASWNTRANVTAALASAQAREEELIAAVNSALDQVIKFRDAKHAAEARAERLEEALRNLLQDTQHKNHDCGDDEWCPVIAARDALSTNAATQTGQATLRPLQA